MKQKGTNVNMMLRAFFGIFMIFVYLGVAVLLFINFFDWTYTFKWPRILLGVLLGLYGIFRSYRLFKGWDYYGGRRKEPESEEDNRIQELIINYISMNINTIIINYFHHVFSSILFYSIY